MSENYLCIHGHFYQPPREDPWMDLVQPEGTAAPSANWNERIVKESYAPLAWARRLDGEGRITELINCYEWMSFNVGPTLLSWMEQYAPEVYARLLEADRMSVLRFGHGNAMAQVYHHQIMPLASALDKEVEVAWSVTDFKARFGRNPEGMWLAETAVDYETLEVLADYDIRFTILAPNQAKALKDGNGWQDAVEHAVDISCPWKVKLPSGRTIAVFFYNGPLSRAVAFENLLKDGEVFWRRVTGAHQGGLTSIGTDGETYGHHYPFGEMALAYVLEMARIGRDDFRLTNYASYLAAHPPTGEVKLHENSSWSCLHGVERWRSNCGCCDGGHAGWHQRWREPLRTGLNVLKESIDEHYFNVGKTLFKDPHNALVSFGMFLCGSIDIKAFKTLVFKSRISLEKIELGFRLLLMQKWGLCMFASCAWFFDDMARVEPRNAMTYALRAMELAEETGAENLLPVFQAHLARAEVNDERFVTGEDVFIAEVLPRRESECRLVAQAVFTLSARGCLGAEGDVQKVCWPGLEVAVNGVSMGEGNALLTWVPGGLAREFSWTWHDREHGNPFSGIVDVQGQGGAQLSVVPTELFWKNREQIVLDWLDRLDEERWSALLHQGNEALARFLEYRAYQATQVRADEWATMWPELASAYVLNGFEGPGQARLVDFLRVKGASHASIPWMARRIGMVLARLVAAKEETIKIVHILERAKAIGFRPEVWQAQNLAWTRADSGGGGELLPVLGFYCEK